MLCLMFVFLTVAVVVTERVAYERIRRDGDYIGNLGFVIGSSTSEQRIGCFMDETDKTAYLFLPSYANMGDIKIMFAGADRIVFAGDEKEITLKSGEHIGALICDEEYQMHFCDRKGRELAQHRLVVMHSASLPAVFMETESGSMEALDADKNYEERGRITLFDVDGSVVCVDKLNRISGRGNSTWAHPKKSYGFRLSTRTDLFGMGSADNWILLSNVEDPAYIRNKITYDMAIAAGMVGSPESQYVDLYINNTYQGMYQLCEKVEIDAERVPIADLGEENRRLNSDIGKYGRFELEKRRGVVLSKEPGDLTGGYLLERDVPEKYREEISGFITDKLGDLYTIKEPTYASEAEVDYISSLVDDMEKAVVSEDGINPDTGMSYMDYIDQRSFAQKYVLEELTKNNGAGATSSFFYKPQDEISTKLFAGPVWDYDKALGELTGMNESAEDLCYLMLRDSNPTTLFWQLTRHPEFREEVSACYEEFFSEYMQDIVDEKADEYATEILPSIAMDQIRWKDGESQPFDYDYEIGRIKNFLSERKLFLDKVWIEREELCTVTFISETSGPRYVSVIAGGTLERLPGSEPGTVSGDLIFDGWYRPDGTLFDGKEPVFEDMTVYSKSHSISGTE